MTFIVVAFACNPEDPIKLQALSEEDHGRWCEAEPREGYKCFREVGRIETPFDLRRFVALLEIAATIVKEE